MHILLYCPINLYNVMPPEVNPFFTREQFLLLVLLILASLSHNVFKLKDIYLSRFILMNIRWWVG